MSCEAHGREASIVETRCRGVFPGRAFGVQLTDNSTFAVRSRHDELLICRFEIIVPEGAHKVIRLDKKQKGRLMMDFSIMKERSPCKKQIVTGRAADEWNIVEGPAKSGHDHFLGVGQPVDEAESEPVALLSCGRLIELPAKTADNLNRPLDRQTVDVLEHLTDDSKSFLRKSYRQDANLAEAFRRDLPRGAATCDRDTGEFV